jgi:hypothetical protein
MIKAAKISFTESKKNIFIYGAINCIIYIFLFILLKYFNVNDLTGLRIGNYVILGLVSLFQTHQLIKQKNGYVPFLQSFFITLFTGACSFFFFAIFVFIYSRCDPYLPVLFNMESTDLNKSISAILVFVEGSGGSIIVALITMFYANRYEDEEAKI